MVTFTYTFQVCHSSKVLYQGFAEKYFLGIYLQLKTKMKILGQCAF